MHPSFLVKKIIAENLLPKPVHALDLGCGEGADAIALAMMGHEVDAIDRHGESITVLNQKSRNLKINARQQTIESFSITPRQYGLVVANNSLPFLSDKGLIQSKLADMFNGLGQNGVVAFSLFGPKDGWGNNTNIALFNEKELEQVSKSFPGKTYYQSTEEGYGLTVRKRLKFWHLFRFIGVKSDNLQV